MYVSILKRCPEAAFIYMEAGGRPGMSDILQGRFSSCLYTDGARIPDDFCISINFY